MHFSWAGLFDGRYDNLTLPDLLLKDDKYDNTRESVRNCDVILLDEVSMLSRKDFEQLGMVCRLARGNNNVFGGIQVMASCDFYQLLPVPGGGRVVRWCWVNFQCRGVLQFGLQ